MNQDDESDSDDIPRLSTDTLAVLEEFLKEEREREQNHLTTNSLTMPKEDWQLSQFWYDDESALTLAKEAVLSSGEDGRIACISCPSIFMKLKELSESHFLKGKCLEFDERFKQIFNENNFIFYDYNLPLQFGNRHPLENNHFNYNTDHLPNEITTSKNSENKNSNFAESVNSEIIPTCLENYFDLVIIDPPFLSEECLRKMVETAKYLSKKKFLLCTGSIMEEYVVKFLDAKKCKFQPKHKNKLSNEFSCFANYSTRLLED